MCKILEYQIPRGNIFVDIDKVHNARNPYQNVFNLDRKTISSGPISDLGIFDDLFESQ